jgi:hypothetical protein
MMIRAKFSRVAVATAAIFLVAFSGWLVASGQQSQPERGGGSPQVAGSPETPTGSQAAAKPSKLARDLIGTWVLVGTPEKIEEPPATGGMLKFITGRHWAITQADPKSAEVAWHHGGTYKLDGDEYPETVEYANRNTAELIKKTHRFKIKVEGDTFTQIGLDNKWSQVWKRAN